MQMLVKVPLLILHSLEAIRVMLASNFKTFVLPLEATYRA